jgi:hypothetical protein
MLIHQQFNQNLTINVYEDDHQWTAYDLEYMHRLKRWLKIQLLEKFPNPQGMRFIIERPNHLHKQLSLIMAIWELGGIIVVYDLHAQLRNNPIYTEFHNNIDVCLIETNDIKFSQIDQALPVFSVPGRLHELQYWFDADWVDDPTNDVILADSNSQALMVKTSGTTRAPEIVLYTHQQILMATKANCTHSEFLETDHVLQLKSFHHGGLCVHYFITSLIYCQQHYFKLYTGNASINQHAIDIAVDCPITRIMFPYEVGTEIIELLEIHLTKSQDLTIHSTHNIPTIAATDRLFATKQVSRFFSFFGCAELISALMMQDLTKHTWPQLREQWNSTVFYETPGNYWSYQQFENGLGVKSPDMDNFYVPGDMFESVAPGAWKWLGRNTQIKRNGFVVDPWLIQQTLEQQIKSARVVVVPDYELKKIYTFLFNTQINQSESDWLVELNHLLERKVNQHHMLDLVMVMTDNAAISAGKQPSLSVLRFLARKKISQLSS